MCGNRFSSVEFHRFLLNSMLYKMHWVEVESEWIMRAKLNEKSSKQHTVRAAADVATNSCDVAVCSFVQWKSVLKFRDYPMHGRMKFLWCALSVHVWEYVFVTKMNVTRFTITQMNLTQNDKSWYEHTGTFISKEFKSNEPLFFSH